MRREGLAVGLFFLAAGALFLLDALEVVSIRAGYLWPLLLIGFGIALIAGGRRRPEPAPEERRDEADREVEEEDEERAEERAEEREAHRADTEAPPDRRDDDPAGPR